MDQSMFLSLDVVEVRLKIYGLSMKKPLQEQFFLVEFRLLVPLVMKRIQQLRILFLIEERQHQLQQQKWPFQHVMNCLKDYWIENESIYSSLSNQIKNEQKRLTSLQHPIHFNFRKDFIVLLQKD